MAVEGQGCPRCGGQVFHAEQMFSKGKTYHKKCFSCNSCKRPLDSVLACDAPDGEIYCKGCYAKNFGAKGQLISRKIFLFLQSQPNFWQISALAS